MRPDWNRAGVYYTGKDFQSFGDKGHRVIASAAAHKEFDWLIDKTPEWAGCDINFITDLDITGGIDPDRLDESELDMKVHEFLDANPSIFKGYTKESSEYFILGAKAFVRHGGDGAQVFNVDGDEENSTVLFIQSVSRRNFDKAAQQGIGCSMRISGFDDAAMTIMHECGHLLKRHSHSSKTEALCNEVEAESLMTGSFAKAIQEGRTLDPKGLETRLAFRSLQSLIWSGRRDVEKINDPLGPDEGFSHGLRAGLSLTNNRLTDEQAEALLRSPIQVNTLTHSLAGDYIEDYQHYFSAMTALHSKGCFGQNTIAASYVDHALQACQAYASEWLDEELIADYGRTLTEINSPQVRWDNTADFFQPSRGRNLGPQACNL